MFDWRRPRLALAMLTGVFVLGTIGYVVLGFSVLDAVYQTVTTVATVGFREVQPLDDAGKVFTIVLILVGVGTALYTFSVVLETLLEGHLSRLFGRRRMERQIEAMHEHVIVCGWGRVGRAIGAELAAADADLVVVDLDATRLADSGLPVARRRRDRRPGRSSRRDSGGPARSSPRSTTTPPTSSSPSAPAALCPDLFIVARARLEETEEKLRRAGADRVVNPQSIGGARIAAFVLQPNVTEFLDVVMHDRGLQFRLEEVLVPAGSAIAGQTIRDAHLRDRTGALVLALREEDGTFNTNPSPDTTIQPGHVLIAIGTPDELTALEQTVEIHGGEVPSAT